MALASRLRSSVLASRFAPRARRFAVAPGGRITRPVAPRRARTLTGRSGRFVVQLRRGRPVRGGFFKSLVKGVGKVVGTVTKLPVIGTVAKAALSSLPIVGQVVTAVSAVKGLTAASASAGIAGGVSSLPAVAGVGLPGGGTAKPRRRRKATTKRKRTRTTKRAKRAKRRSKGGSAKQRAARARFARAAKRGRIKKGTRLR